MFSAYKALDLLLLTMRVMWFITGVLIVAVGLLYIIKSCADCRCVGGRKYVRRKRRGHRKKKSQTDEETPALAPSGAADER